jgi:hypothetical protein
MAVRVRDALAHVYLCNRHGYQRVLSVGIKRPERESDHFHLVPMLRMRGVIPPLPQYIFMA